MEGCLHKCKHVGEAKGDQVGVMKHAWAKPDEIYYHLQEACRFKGSKLSLKPRGEQEL